MSELTVVDRIGTGAPAHGVSHMTNKPLNQDDKKQADIAHSGMMGDGTEEQNLNERGNAGARIKKDELNAAFTKQDSKKL